jgi:ABC-2 type transport system ATP-binding protein
VLGTNKHSVILSLKEGIDQWKVLEALKKENIDIKTFGAYEPSLNDIFVSRVGEEEPETTEEKPEEAKTPGKKNGLFRKAGR